MHEKMTMEYWWNDTDRETEALRESWRSDTSSAVNFTWTDLGSDPGFRTDF